MTHGASGGRLFDTLFTFFIALIVSFVAAIHFYMSGGREALPVGDDVVRRAFDAERALAERAGLRPREDVRVAAGTTRRDVRLNPGECLSVIVGVSGLRGSAPLQLVDARTGATLAGERSLGNDFVRHRQWCSPPGGDFTLTVSAPAAPRLALLVGVPRPDALPLPRAHPPAEALAALRDEAVTAAMDRDAGPRLVPVTRLAALAPPMLLPATPATRAALREAMLLDPDADLATVPLTPAPEAIARHDLADDAPAPPATAADDDRPRRRRRHSPAPTEAPAPARPATHPVSASDAVASLRVLGVAATIVAVVDPGALGAGCVALRFTSAGAEPAAVLRVGVPGWRAEAVAAPGGVARDVVCPADGLRLYALLSPARPAALAFAVESAPGADAGPAAPSAWRGESSPHSLVARLEADCERDVRGCVGLVDLASVPLRIAPRPDRMEALRRACARGHGESCGLRGAELLAAPSPDVAAAVDALRRGCDLGHATTCAVLATHERLGDAGVAQDLRAALDHYSSACALGDAAACGERDTMRLLHLPG